MAKDNLFIENSRKNSFLCGLCAGAAEAMFVVTPQETIKTRLIHDKLSPAPQFKNVFHGIYTIAAEHGPAGLYRGGGATFMKQSSNQGVRFLVFNDTNEYLIDRLPSKIMSNMIAGGFAGFCSVMANNPVDVIKTKMQGLDAAKYKSVMDCG